MAQKATISAVLTLALAASSALAQPPLPPGHPAGVRKAELSDKQTIFIGGTALVLGIGLYLASGSYKLAGGATTPPAVTPPTTTTTTTTS
jgi:hypothetical protein